MFPLTRTVSLFLFAVLAAGLLGSAAAIADERTSASEKEIMAVCDKLRSHFSNGDFEAAMALMGEGVADPVVADYLLLAADTAKGNPSTDLDKKMRDKFLAISKKYGLIEAVPTEYFEGTEFTYSEFDALITKTNKNLLSKVSTKANRLAALRDIHQAIFSLNADQAWQYVQHPFYEEGKVSGLKSKGNRVSARVDTQGEPTFLMFEKTGQGWLWVGYDSGRGSAEPSFTPVSDIRLSGKTLDGKSVSLADFKGKVVLVDFWGTWCAPCVAEMPNLKKIYEQLNQHGFEIIGVAADDRESLTAFLKKRKLPWQNILDEEGKLVDQFRVSQFPTAILVDQQGEHFESNVFGADLLRTVAAKLKLDPKEYKTLLSEISGEADDAKHGHDDEDPTIGFKPADTDSNGLVSSEELKQYLSSHLKGVDLPHKKIFSRLDKNSNSSITEEEFADRHAVIEHFMGEDFFKQDSWQSPADPGNGYVVYHGLKAGIKDSDVYGAAYHRYLEVVKRVGKAWKPHDLAVLPRTAPAGKTPELVNRVADQAAGSAPQSPSVDGLMRATVIMVGGGKESFFTSGGVIVSREGHVVTNYHVAKELELTPMVAITHDGKPHRVVEFISGNAERDTALVRIEGANFDYAPVATDLPQVGDDLAMVHHSENRFFTYDRGYLMRRPIVGEHAWMEVSMDYAPGGSGCGIYNGRHQLVGLVSTIQYGDGPTLSEPVDWDTVDWETEEGGNAILMVKHAVSLSAIHDLLGKAIHQGSTKAAASKQHSEPALKQGRKARAASTSGRF